MNLPPSRPARALVPKHPSPSHVAAEHHESSTTIVRHHVVLVSSLCPPKYPCFSFSLTLQSTPRRPSTQKGSPTNRLSPCRALVSSLCPPKYPCFSFSLTLQSTPRRPSTQKGSPTNRLSPCRAILSHRLTPTRSQKSQPRNSARSATSCGRPATFLAVRRSSLPR